MSKAKDQIPLILMRTLFVCALSFIFPFEQAHAACSSPTANVGSLDFQSGAFKFCNGSSWVSMTSGSPGGVSSPSTSMSIQYNDSGILAGTLSFVYDKTNSRVGIGSATPARTLDVAGGGVGPGLDFYTARFASTDKQRMLDIGQQTDTGGDARYFIQGGRGDANAETNYYPYDLLINPKGGVTILGPGIQNFRSFGTALDVRGPQAATLDDWGPLTVTVTDAPAQDVGGQITFGGQFDNSLMGGFAAISGRKENATLGNWLGYMSFGTTRASGTLTEAMRINSSGYVGIGTTNPGQLLEVAGNAKVEHIVGRTLTPNFAAGGGAGTGPTIAFTNSTDLSGLLNVTTGTAPAAATIVTVSFRQSYGTAPNCVLTAANANTAPKATSIYLTSTTSGFSVVATAALTASTAYSWYYQCMQ